MTDDEIGLRRIFDSRCIAMSNGCSHTVRATLLTRKSTTIIIHFDLASAGAERLVTAAT